MTAIATSFRRSAAPASQQRTNLARYPRRRLLRLLDQMLPPRRDDRDAPLPPEWFKYPAL